MVDKDLLSCYNGINKGERAEIPMKTLTGTIAHNMDAKYRIRIPKKFKDEMTAGNEQLHFVRLGKGFIAVMNDTVLGETFGAFKNISVSDTRRTGAKRSISSGVFDVEEDTQGRTSLPKSVRDFIGADKDHTDLVAIGMGNYIEIWTQEAYDAEMESWTIEDALKAIDDCGETR